MSMPQALQASWLGPKTHKWTFRNFHHVTGLALHHGFSVQVLYRQHLMRPLVLPGVRLNQAPCVFSWTLFVLRLWIAKSLKSKCTWHVCLSVLLCGCCGVSVGKLYISTTSCILSPNCTSGRSHATTSSTNCHCYTAHAPRQADKHAGRQQQNAKRAGPRLCWAAFALTSTYSKHCKPWRLPCRILYSSLSRRSECGSCMQLYQTPLTPGAFPLASQPVAVARMLVSFHAALLLLAARVCFSAVAFGQCPLLESVATVCCWGLLIALSAIGCCYGLLDQLLSSIQPSLGLACHMTLI